MIKQARKTKKKNFFFFIKGTAELARAPRPGAAAPLARARQPWRGGPGSAVDFSIFFFRTEVKQEMLEKRGLPPTKRLFNVLSLT